MISKERHKKHGNISRAELGRFGRNEVAVLGTTCEQIHEFVTELRTLFLGKDIAFVDADHHVSEDNFLGAHLQLKSDSVDLKVGVAASEYENKIHLSQSDLIIVNGNHFEANHQVIICNPDKENSLIKRAAQLTNVKAIFLVKGQKEVPDYVKTLLSNYKELPIVSLSDKSSVQSFFQTTFFKSSPLKALILAGGRSTRMGKDKATLQHHDEAQFLHLKKMLDDLKIENFVSCRPEQSVFYESNGCRTIQDVIQDLGPLGGIISAFMKYPDNAWLVVASDIPLLDKEILNELMSQRNTTKIATCFKSSFDGFPEPLITIWEPKSYMRIMEFLAQGYDCPRKVLINTNVQIIEPTQPQKLTNVNTPDELSKLNK